MDNDAALAGIPPYSQPKLADWPTTAGRAEKDLRAGRGLFRRGPKGAADGGSSDARCGLLLGPLLRSMEAVPEPYMDANADIIRKAWCALEVVNLIGPPHNA